MDGSMQSVKQSALQSIVVDKLIELITNGTKIKRHKLINVIDMFYRKYGNSETLINDVHWTAKLEFGQSIVEIILENETE